MAVDKDQPHTWVKYKASLCKTCIGTCCTMPAEVMIEDLLRLGKVDVDEVSMTRGKVVNRLKKEGIVSSYRASTGKFTLTRRPNGDCLFLDQKSRLCSVYEKRPDLCRDFPTSKGNRPGYCPSIKQ